MVHLVMYFIIIQCQMEVPLNWSIFYVYFCIQIALISVQHFLPLSDHSIIWKIYKRQNEEILIFITFQRHYENVLNCMEKLEEEGLDASSWLARGPGVASTLKEAARLEAGLIVVGTHGHGAVYDALIGSFSAGIIRKSKLPVLVVPVRGS